jgi:hypothetical protein
MVSLAFLALAFVGVVLAAAGIVWLLWPEDFSDFQ